MAQDTGRIVFILRRDTKCGRCEDDLGKGRFICLSDDQASCLKCAGIDHLEFLPSGDAAVTRRATKHSSQHVVVMKKSAARKRSERQGILAEPEAIRRAEEESADDAETREARRKQEAKRREVADRAYVAQFAETIHKQYPGCPRQDVEEIAGHACEKYTGRVGRSAAAKQFDANAVQLAVVAHVRHKYTDYDRLLAPYDDRQEARREVRARIEAILGKWEHPA